MFVAMTLAVCLPVLLCKLRLVVQFHLICNRDPMLECNVGYSFLYAILATSTFGCTDVHYPRLGMFSYLLYLQSLYNKAAVASYENR